VDPSASSGLNMTVVGLITVFLALSLLIVVVTIMARLVGGSAATAPARATAAGTSSTAAAGESAAFERDELARVAVAAYALHQARRVSVRGPAPASPWLRAGRQTQVDRMR
jgi:sodium pump decarboxylase gamma subunit